MYRHKDTQPDDFFYKTHFLAKGRERLKLNLSCHNMNYSVLHMGESKVVN